MEIIKYKNNEIEIDVRFDYEHNTVWLTQQEIGYLCNVSRTSIARYINEISLTNIINSAPTCSTYEQVQSEGTRKISRKIKVYNLEIIVAIGYKINSSEVATFKNFVESKLLENKTKPAILNEKPYEIVTFVDDELQIDLNVDVENDTVWLTQSQMAELFLVTKENIRQHIKNILDDNELNDSVTKNFLVPAQDGKAYNTKLLISIS